MTQANITIEDIPATLPGVTAKLVKFQGQLDESNVDEKAKIIYQILEQTPKNLYLLFDFDQLEYMNSKSIGYLTDWYGKITEGEGKIAIAKPKSNILDILQVVGLTQLVNCYQTLDEAKFALLQNIAPATATPTAAPSATEVPATEATPAVETPATTPSSTEAPTTPPPTETV